MKLSDVLKDIEIIAGNAEGDTDISDICYDSRACKKGVLFVAVKGFESDGHNYIGKAMAAGALGVICEVVPADENIPYILVKNSRLALALASRNYFKNPGSEMKLIGVTGTNGKTTSTILIKFMLEYCLNAKVGLVGTNQNMIGYRVLHTERTTPESYELQKLLREMADEGCTYGVMEVSSHSLSLDRVAGLSFDTAVFTNLTQDHLDFHRDMDDYANAKAKLFGMSDKCAVNIDDDYAGIFMAASNNTAFTYSVKGECPCLRAKNISLKADSISFTAETDSDSCEIELKIPGMFSVYNALSVISCGLLQGLSLEQTAQALKNAQGVKGRMESVKTDGQYTMLIDYAHTPDALENVLKSLKDVSRGRVVALFGCGGDRDRKKRPLMGAVASEYADFVIVTSDNPRTEEPMDIIDDILVGIENTGAPYVIIEDRIKAIHYAIDNHRPDDVIVLAGKGHETYQIVGKEKRHMDEREIIAEHLTKQLKK